MHEKTTRRPGRILAALVVLFLGIGTAPALGEPTGPRDALGGGGARLLADWPAASGSLGDSLSDGAGYRVVFEAGEPPEERHTPAAETRVAESPVKAPASPAEDADETPEKRTAGKLPEAPGTPVTAEAPEAPATAETSENRATSENPESSEAPATPEAAQPSTPTDGKAPSPSPRWRTTELSQEIAGRKGARGLRLPAAPNGRPYTVTVTLPEARPAWLTLLGDGADGVFAEGTSDAGDEITARRDNRFDREQRGADLVFTRAVRSVELTVSEGAPAGLVLAGPFGSEEETERKASGAKKDAPVRHPAQRTRRASACTPSAGFTDCTLFSYTGGDQNFTVPTGVSSLNVQVWGAGGGGDNASYYTGQVGGAGGGYTTGTVAVTPGQALTVTAGQGGVFNSTATTYGGGGAGGRGQPSTATGASGGGMSALWNGASFTTPLLIAGGGGGASPGADQQSPKSGGGGGTTGGGDGNTNTSGQGGTQSAGGTAGAYGSQCGATSNPTGRQWFGGNGYNTLTTRGGEGGGGGGGGWYGGGGGSCQPSAPTLNPNGPGGGGSGYVSGAGVTNASTTAGSNATTNNQGGAAAGTGSAQYPSGVGAGGGSTANGGNGAVVIQWVTQTSLSVTKTASPNPYVPGNRVTYTITVSNAGPAPATNATIQDTIPSDLSGTTWTCTAAGGSSCGAASGSGNNLNTTATVAVNGTVTYTVTGTTPGSDTSTLSNTVTVTPPSGVKDTTCGASCTATATTPPNPRADLAAAKTTSTQNVSPGQTYTYTLTTTNNGPSSAQGVSMTDTLPNNVTFQSGSGCTASGQNVTCGPLQTLATGASQSWTITVLLASSYRGNGSDIGNTATANSSTDDPNPGNNSASSGPPPIVPQSDYDVTPSAPGGTVAPGTTTSIPVVVRNNGPADAQGDVTVTITLPANVTASGTQPSGCTANSAGTVVTCTLASLPSGASRNLPISVLVASDAPPNSTLTQPGGIVVSGPNDSVSSNNTAPATVSTTGGTSDLTVGKTANPTDVGYGRTTVFTVTVTNNGPSDATNVQVTDQLPSGLTYVSDDSNGAYDAGTGVWTAGTVPNGQSATLHITARMTSTTSQTNAVTQATSSGTDPSPCDSSHPANCASATVNPIAADVVTTKAATGTPVAPGQTFQYRITTTNNGPSAAQQVSVTDTLPAQLTFVSSATGCTATGQNVTCPQIASLANGASRTNTITVLISPSYTGDGSDIANTATSTSTTPDPTPGNNTSPPSSPQVSGPRTGLSISKTGSSTSYQPGQSFSYTVIVNNAGPSTAAGPTVSDTLPGGFSDFGWNCAAGNGSSCGAGSGSGNISDKPTIAPGGTITYTLTGTVPASTSGNQTNTATVTPPTGTTDSNCSSPCTASVTTNGPAVRIKKTSSPAPAKAGQKVTYTVTLTNNGGGDATNFAYTDDLSDVIDDATYHNDATATAGSVSYTAPKLTWNGTVPAGGTVTVTYTATVNNPPAGNQVLNNSVTGPASSNCGPGSTDPDCSDDNGGGIPRLTISKATDASGTVNPGQKVTYTVTLTNPGTATYPGASWSDDLTGVLDDATYNADAAASTGTTSYSAPKLTWNGTLAAGATATITYSATVNSPDTGDNKLVNQITSTPDANCAPCTTTNNVAALTFTKTVSDTNPKPGEKVTYTVTVQNTGSATYTGASFSDDLTDVIDDATYGNDQAASVGSASYAAPKVTWTGDLPAGQTATITYSATVDNPDTGNGKMVNSVTGPAGSNCAAGSTDPACSTGDQPGNGIPQLKITKSFTPARPAAGQTVTYTVVAQNTGTATYPGATWSDDLSDLTDDGTYNDDAGASSGTASYTAPNLTWTGDLAAGAKATTTYSVTLANPLTGDKQLVNKVTSTPDTNCASGSTDPNCGDRSPVPVQQLTMTKSASTTTPKPGDTVTYTATVTNSGTAAVSSASFTDDLTALLDDAAYNDDAGASTGTASYTAPTLTWTGSLDPGARATITYSITVNDPDTGDQVLKNTLVSPTPGGNCASGSTDPACTAGPYDVPSLTMTKTVAPANPLPGDTVTYTVTLHNPSNADYSDAAFTDDLTSVLDNATWLNRITTGDGALTYTAPKVTWTGDVAAGQTQTVTYALKLNNPPTGDGKITNTVVGPPGSNCEQGSTDNRCSAAIDGLPELHITKTLSPAGPVAGGTATYTVTVQNTGSATYPNAVVTDDLTGVLDDAAYNDDASATAGSVTYAQPKLTWTGTLDPGAQATITYSVNVTYPGTGDQRLNNAVTGPQGSNCEPGTTDTDCSSSSGIGRLKIAKSYTPQNGAVPGSKVTYTVTVQNTGTGTYPGASWTDDLTGVLDDAAYNSDANADTGAVSYTSPNLSWTGDLTAGRTATITYSVTVDDPDTGDKQLANTVTGPPGSNCATGSTDPACSPTPSGVPTLSISKSASTGTPTPGTKVTYTVTIQNTGTATYAGASVSDDLTDVLDDATYGNDQAATAGSVSYAAPEVTWTGDVPAGRTVTLTYSATVNTPDTGNGKMVNSVVGPPGSNCETGKQDASCATGDQPGDGIPQLALSKTVSPANPVPGTKVTYTVTAKNTGTATYTGASFSDDLSDVIDDATYGNDQTATVGSATYTAPKVSWTGDLTAGQTATITYSATVNNPDTGDKTLTNSVVGPAGSNCAPGSQAAACATSTGSPQLVLNKTYTPNNPLPGQKVTYTITATNTGTATYTGATWSDDLTGVLDDAAYNDDATASLGTTSYTSPKLTWTGDVPAGQTATVTYSATVDDPDTGDKSLSNTVTGTPDATCASGGTANACTPSPAGVPQLSITKSASTGTPVPGTKVTYTVTIQNTGTATYTGASVSDDLTDVIDDATYGNDQAATAGSVSYTAPKVTWTGDVPAGRTVTLTYSATVNNPVTGNLKLVNSVVGPQGSNCEAGKRTASCSTGGRSGDGVPNLRLTKTSSAASTAPGSTVTYTITAQNTGTATYTGASWSDDLSGVLDDATYNDDASADSGSVNYTAPKLSWTGDVMAGQTVTTTYTVTINNPSTSSQSLTNTVTSTPDTNCPTGTTNSDCTATVGIPQISLTKTASTTSPLPGQQVTYTVTVRNTGTVEYEGATFTDDLSDVTDDAAYGDDAAATLGSVDYAAPHLTWTGDIPVGQTATVTYSVTVDSDPARLGNGVLANAVTSTGPGSNCTTPSVSGCSTTSDPVPTLRITKTQTTPAALPGGKVAYQVTITNPTTSDYPNAAYTDDLTGVLDDAAYANDASATAGSVTYTAPKLTWSGDVPGGATITLTYSVTVDTTNTGDGDLANTVAANVPGSNCPAGSTDPSCATGGSGTSYVPHLTIVKTVNDTDPLPGDLLTYTVVATNDSKADYPGATYTDQLTAGANLVNQRAIAPPTATSGTVTAQQGHTFTWTGDLAAGASATVTYTYMANAVPTAGSRQVVNQITGASANTTCHGNTADAGYPAGCGATVTTPRYDFGEAPNSYGTTISANGPYHAIVPGLGLGDGPVAGVDGTPNGPRLNRTTGRGPTSLPAAYSGGTGYRTTVDLTNTTGTPTLLAAWLDHDLDGVFSRGERVLRTVPDGAKSVALSWPDATFTKTGTTYLRLRLYGEQVPPGAQPELPAGETRAVVRVGGKLRAVPVRRALPADPRPTGYGGAGQVEDFRIKVRAGELAVKITVDNPRPKPGDRVTYTVTVCSTTGVPYTGATASANLAQVLKYATYNRDERASTGKATYASGKVSWTGTAPADCSHPATITFSVTYRGTPPPGTPLDVPVTGGPSGSNCPPGATAPACHATITPHSPVRPLPDTGGRRISPLWGVAALALLTAGAALVLGVRRRLRNVRT
ncbi:DUF11 domain-containing protein [Streptomyces roseirectus]|uniref:receptor protein-tyrosine kinase n=1 Tax=Streptomyces roseirectus TaxID=2768066 RepID=A0A7H0IPI7_9ACTN|nr:glycine-rich protein [Streptomyces roseirectus]QNP74703.1 DUF11 domain-containing protein [Streptomyces roseirectus]